jgi:predicted regulator of Ras-like GTPase activity (Roadblock/LC7/MglB family)
MASEVEETLERIQRLHKGVQGVIVTNSEGVVIRSTVSEPNEATESYTQVLTEIVERSKAALRDNDELTFLKIRTKKAEFIVVPDKDYILITLFNPSNESTA